jgi:flagellar biosynthesis/type III secretory pathway M-ring protein FliF/YscJ
MGQSGSRSSVKSSEFQGRRTTMEAKNETTESKGKFASYVRWFFVTVFGLIILFTVIMAAVRKFGG